MADLDDRDRRVPILDLVHDPILTLPNPQLIFPPRQLHAPDRAWILGEASNPVDDPLAVFDIRDCFQLSYRRAFQEDAIASNALAAFE